MESNNMQKPKGNPKKKPFPPKPNPNKKNPKPNNFYWIYAIVGVVLIGLNVYNYNFSLARTDYGNFKEMVENNEVQKIIVYNEKNGRSIPNQRGSTT